MKHVIVLILSIISYSVLASELILKEDSFGPLELHKEAKVSVSKLQKLFPQYTISHGIGQGDSPDFHYFDVKGLNSKAIFSVISFIETESDAHKELVKIDLLEIYDAEIKDQYGISNGMRYSDIIKKRGKKLIFGANHHDNHIGINNVWYNLSSKGFATPGGPDINPVNISLEDVEKINPKIIVISWPAPRW